MPKRRTYADGSVSPSFSVKTSASFSHYASEVQEEEKYARKDKTEDSDEVVDKPIGGPITAEGTMTKETDIEMPKGLPEPAIPDAPPEDVPHAENGISDPVLVLRLAYLQEKVTRLNAQEVGYNLLFDNRRRQVEEERTTTMTQVRRDKVIAEGEYRAIQRDIENKHNISLKDFTFDPDTGSLNRIVEISGEPT